MSSSRHSAISRALCSDRRERKQHKRQEAGNENATSPRASMSRHVRRTLDTFFRAIFSKKNDTDLCPICDEKPPESGEEWCILPCGHKFGHLCLRALIAVPLFRVCPTCATAVWCKCGHPVTPAAVPGLHGPLRLRELKRTALLLDEQMRSDCAFCKEHNKTVEDTAVMLAKLELGAGKKLKVLPCDGEWRAWWDEETEKIPSKAKENKGKVEYHFDIYL